MASRGLDTRRRSPRQVTSPASGVHEAGQDLQQRGLAGAVLADQRMGFALDDVEAHAVHGLDGAKGFVDVAEAEAHGRAILHCGAW